MKLLQPLALSAMLISIAPATFWEVPLDERIFRQVTPDSVFSSNDNSRVQFGWGAPALYTAEDDHWFLQSLYLPPYGTIPLGNDGLAFRFMVMGPNMGTNTAKSAVPFDRIEVALFGGTVSGPNNTPLSFATGSGTAGVWSFAKSAAEVNVFALASDYSRRYDFTGQIDGIYSGSPTWMPTVANSQVYEIEVTDLSSSTSTPPTYQPFGSTFDASRYWVGVRFISDEEELEENDAIRLIPVEAMDASHDNAKELINGTVSQLLLSNEATEPAFRKMAFWTATGTHEVADPNNLAAQAITVEVDFDPPVYQLNDYQEAFTVLFDNSLGGRYEFLARSNITSGIASGLVQTFYSATTLSGSILVKPRNALAVEVTSVTFGSTSTPPIYYATCKLGDCDNSNEIDAADIDIVTEAFGSVWVTRFGFDPTFDPSQFGAVGYDKSYQIAADVDRSGEVDSADIDIVIANFGAGDS